MISLSNFTFSFYVIFFSINKNRINMEKGFLFIELSLVYRLTTSKELSGKVLHIRYVLQVFEIWISSVFERLMAVSL